MLFKFNVNGVVITETQKNGTTTTLKIDSINLEQECAKEEIGVLVNSITNIAKNVTTAKDVNTNTNKRYHVEKYKIDGIWECQKYHYYYLVFDNVTADYYIKLLFENGDVLIRKLATKVALTVYGSKNKEKYIVNKYSCNNFRL